MNQLTVGIRQEGGQAKVVWSLAGRFSMAMSCRLALAVCEAMRDQIRAARATGELPAEYERAASFGGQAVAVRVEPGKVQVLANGALLFDAPPDVAEQLWRETLARAKQIEEMQQAEQVIADGALLFRTGAPFGLTDNPILQAEIVKEAVHDRTLRRCLPDGIKSTAVLGTPTVTQADPHAELRRLVAQMSPADRRAFERTLTTEEHSEHAS